MPGRRLTDEQQRAHRTLGRMADDVQLLLVEGYKRGKRFVFKRWGPRESRNPAERLWQFFLDATRLPETSQRRRNALDPPAVRLQRGRAARFRSHTMKRSLVSKIQAANAALLVSGNVSGIGTFFAPDYFAHFTGQDLTGGHAAIRAVIELYRRAFRGLHAGDFKGFPATGRRILWRDMVTSRFRGGLIAEDWPITDLAERLLLARKR